MTTAFDTSQYEVVSKPSYDTSAYEPVKDNFDSSLYEKVDSNSYNFSELSPAGKALDVAGGVIETIPGMIAGFAASAPAAVVGGWDALFGDKGTAGERYLQGYQGTHEAIAKAIPYEPETATGRAISEKAGQIFEYLPEKAGEKTYEKTGSPVLATAAKTAVAGAELLLPFFLGRKKVGIPKETESIPVTTQEIPKVDAAKYEIVKPAETEIASSVSSKSDITNDVITPKETVVSEPDMSIARQEAIKTTQDLFPENQKTGTTFYSGIPVEEIGNSIKLADNVIKDKLGIPEPELKIETPTKEISLSPLDYAKSPRIIEKKFPEFAPFKGMADRSRVIQDTLRDAFEKRLKSVDESLGGGISKIKDFGKSYNENKSSLREILLTEDFIGKRFSKEELVSEFKAKPEVINAHRLIRSALDHAYEIASKTRELRDKKAPEYRQGYVPHFFHDFFVKADGKIVGSAKTLSEATSMGNKLVRAGKQVNITPKQFEFPGEQLQAVLLGDAQYFKLKNSFEEAFSLKPEEASSIMDEMIHRRGRSRFVGNFLQRKGAEGWDKNLDYAIPHYLNMISRYAAMDRFKLKAISRFENKFGPFDKEYTGIAKYTKNYINDVLGVPTKIETVLNNLIKDNPILNNLVGKYLGERPSLQIAAGANKAVTVMSFGFANISAGLVNLFQLQMGYTLLGARWLTEGIKRSVPIIKAAAERKIGLESKANPDIGILRQLDVEIQQGLESPSGYSKFGELAGVAGKTLALWKAAEWENRAVVGLGAYYRGLSLGMTKVKAIEYARDVNTRVNFDYSVQDAPAIFRRSGPPGSMMLQFKKFPVKSIEFMSELKGMENARFWIPLFVVSGLYAFPGVEAVKNLVKSLFGIDAELEVKKSLMKWAGEDHEKQAIAKTIFYGAFANEELGGIDVSHRIGTGDFIPSRVPDFMGPFFSKTVRAIQLTSQGNVDDAIRAVSPGLGNPILAVTSEKVTSPTNRDRLVTTLDTKERTAKAAGFRTAKEAVETDKSRIISYETQKYNEDKKRAIDDLIKAAVSKNAKAIKKTSDRIRELQIDITKENINQEVLQKNLTASQRAYLNAPNLVKGKTKEVFKFK